MSQQARSDERPQQPTKTSCKTRNDQKWDLCKQEIRRIYVAEDDTLQATRRLIQETFGFKASERKWKMKLKEWGFEKYLPASEMNILVAKAEKRKREGKETAFFHSGNEIKQEKFENFKKRKTVKLGQIRPASPTAATPANVTYHTPLPVIEPIDADSPDNGQLSASGRSHNQMQTGNLTIHLDQQTTRTPVVSASNVNLKGLATNNIIELDLGTSTQDSSFSPSNELDEDDGTTVEDQIVQTPDHWISDPHNTGRIAITNNWHMALQTVVEYAKLRDLVGDTLRGSIESLLKLPLPEQPKLTRQIVPMLRQLWDASKRLLGEGNMVTMHLMCTIAVVLEEKSEYREAEDTYLSALKLMNDGSSHSSRVTLQCALNLTVLCLMESRFNQGVSVLVIYLDRSIKSGYFASRHGFPLRNLDLDHLSSVISRSTSSLFHEKCPSREWRQLVKGIDRIRALLLSQQTLESRFRVLLGAVDVAASLSQLGKPKAARILFERSIAELSRYNDVDWGWRKVDAYLAYCTHHQRLERFYRCIDDVKSAYRRLMGKDNRQIISDRDTARRLQAYWKELEERLLLGELELEGPFTTEVQRQNDLAACLYATPEETKYEKTLSKLQVIREMDRALTDSKPTWGLEPLMGRTKPTQSGIEAEDRVNDFATETGETAYTDERSYKYGITYSVSDITGITYSAYMRP